METLEGELVEKDEEQQSAPEPEIVQEALAALPAVVEKTGAVSHRIILTEDDIQMVRDTYAPDLNDAEARLFFAVAQDRGLDPRARQIHGIVRISKKGKTDEKRTLSIQTSIDGFRLIAQRTGKYRGQVPIQWCGADGKWMDFWPFDYPPTAAKAGILHADFDEPMYAVAMFREYVQTDFNGNPNTMWNKMGAGQCAKCAEALAFRRAFPEDLSGIYTDDEMGQADNERQIVEGSVAPSQAPQVVEGPQFTKLQFELKNKISALPPEQRAQFADIYTKRHFPKVQELSDGAARAAIRKLEEMVNANAQAAEDPTRPFEEPVAAKVADPETGEIQEYDEAALMAETKAEATGWGENEDPFEP